MIAAALGFAFAVVVVLAAAPPSLAQSSVRLPPASGMLGALRRGRDGQIEVIPGSARPRQGSRTPSMPPAGEVAGPVGTPWTAKTQHARTPQPRFEEAAPED
jgi:hypothetical protein